MPIGVTFGLRELNDASRKFQGAAGRLVSEVQPVFDEWVEECYEIVRDETPVDEGELKESTVIIQPWRDTPGNPLSAEVYPQKRVQGSQGTHGLAFLIEYGVGDRPPNPFITRSAQRSLEAAEAFEIPEIL